jgi:hypothetical protein
MTSRFRRRRRTILAVWFAFPIVLFAIIIYLSIPAYLSTSLITVISSYLSNVYGHVSGFSYSLGQIDPTLTFSQFLGVLGFVMPILALVGGILRETEVLDRDVILASPLKSRDLLFGRFVANLFWVPLYLLPIILYSSEIFMAHGLNSLATPFIMVFAVMLPIMVGSWVGVLLSSYLQMKSVGSPRFRDIARAIIGVAVVFLIILFVNITLVQTSSIYWTFSPTTWVTNIIYIAATGSNLVRITNAVGVYSFSYYVALQPDLAISIVLLLILVVFVFLAGIRLSDRIFRFEAPMGGVKAIEKESWVFRAVRRAIPSPLGAVTAVQLKEFSRNVGSIARVSFVVVFPLVIVLLNSKLVGNLYVPATSTSTITTLPLLASIYLVYTPVVISMIEASQMTVKQMDLFWTYKKAPHGVENLVYSKLLEMLIVGILLGIVLAVLFQVGLGPQFSQIVTIVPAMLFMIIIGSAIALGIYCARPVFKERSSGNMINFIILIVILFPIEGVILLFLVFPWIPNIISSLPALSILLGLRSQSSIYILQTPIFLLTLAQLGVNTMSSILGVTASVVIGVAAAYISLRIGVSKLKRYE